MRVALVDPTYTPRETETLSERTAAALIQDPRDLPFVKLMVVLSLLVIPTGVWLFLPGAFRWWLAGLHLAVVVYFLGPFVLMLHNTSHRKLFKRRWDWMNAYIPWILGPFFGESPETYFAHHVGMHHPENNLHDDLSCTLPYRRDSVIDFLRYFTRFMFIVLFELLQYFAKKGRRALMLRCLGGEAAFYAVVIALSFVEWRATLMVFVAPFLITRFAMMAGNWAQHAFIDEASPANSYRNSITCINSTYNRRCFNDGYHIGHHLKQTRHWTEMPVEFAQNIDQYAAERAIVFEGIDFFGVWFCLMLGRYDWLARRYVTLGETRPSDEEIIAMLQSRTRWTSTPETVTVATA
ncbi:MAG TPA: fatty acid desaturase [Polyangiaceae bacterium]|jgi:fatty acid desaturase|nr:fatty acid desaturase [Polyangiaceae bacterium]